MVVVVVGVVDVLVNKTWLGLKGTECAGSAATAATPATETASGGAAVTTGLRNGFAGLTTSLCMGGCVLGGSCGPAVVAVKAGFLFGRGDASMDSAVPFRLSVEGGGVFSPPPKKERSLWKRDLLVLLSLPLRRLF